MAIPLQLVFSEVRSALKVPGESLVAEMDMKRSGLADFRGMWEKLPSGYVKIAIEHGPFIVEFPIHHGDFP